MDAFGALWFGPLMLFGLGLALIIGGVAFLVSAASGALSYKIEELDILD